MFWIFVTVNISAKNPDGKQTSLDHKFGFFGAVKGS